MSISPPGSPTLKPLLPAGKSQASISLKLYVSSYPQHLPDQYSEIPECAQLYFGLLPDAIRKIKGICSNKKAVLIPYTSSKYLALLCEVLGVELMGGTFTQTSNAILFEEEHNNDNSEN